jgi:AcrR family transcriptional regulator
MSGSIFSRARAKPYHHGDLRRALLDATLQLIEEQGPQGFTLRAAARRAGVTAGATYHHFKDKEDLVAAVAEEGFQLLRKELIEAADKPCDSARDRSRNVAVAYVLFAVRQPTRFRVMVGYGVLARHSAEGVSNQALDTYRLVRDILIDGLTEHSGQPVSEADVLAWGSVVHGLAFLAIDGYSGRVSGKRIQDVTLAVIDALDRRSSRSVSGVRRRVSQRGAGAGGDTY